MLQPQADSMEVMGAGVSTHSPQSEAVTSELQELSLQPAPKELRLQERKNVLQLKLQQRRTREELVSQGIMPPLKSPAAFHEQRRSLERARTEDYLKRKIRSRPERSELVRMHILEETSAEPSLQAKQLQLKRARLADDLNDKISHRPGPIELVHKNILSVCPDQHSPPDSPKGAGGEISSLDEDSSDALSPDQLANHDSPVSTVPQPSPSEVLAQNGDMSPTQFVMQAAPKPPPAPVANGSGSPPPVKVANGTITPRTPFGQLKSHSKTNSERPPLRSKKAKDSKPKVKKLKYHQYIPPDQKADKERPPLMDSSYAKLLQQQQLFLQLQILNQQQQHYNYHTILPAPPKPAPEQPLPTNPSPSPTRNVPTAPNSTSTPTNGNARQGQTSVGGAKPTTLPANLDEFKVAELKQELKLRGLTVSGTKNDLIERLRHYQEQNAAPAAVSKNDVVQPIHPSAASASSTVAAAGCDPSQAEGGGFKVALSPLTQSFPGRVIRFGSTSSSPPVSPSPSERSLAGLSPDETSCNGDMFGEMVSSPLTQLTLHPSPQQPSTTSPLSQPISKPKEEGQSSCSLHRSSPGSVKPPEPFSAVAMDSSSLDKDQMLQEKDKQIEELTRMLRQKQRLVETLRSQLELGKMAGGVSSEREGSNKRTASPNVKTQTPVQASAVRPSVLPNGLVKVKLEAETEKSRTGVREEAQSKRVVQPMQYSKKSSDVKPQTLIKASAIQPPVPPNGLVKVKQETETEMAPVLINQQSGTQIHTQAISLDLLKAGGTLVTDSNGNHYLIALTGSTAESQNQRPSQSKSNGHVTLQRLQSTPNKLPSTCKQSQEQKDSQGASGLVKKELKANRHANINGVAAASSCVTAPPALQPFFSDPSDSESQSSLISSFKTERVCPSYDRHTLFTPPSPKPNTFLPTQRSKGNDVSCQQMDDLFDILLRSGEITGFKANPDPSLAPLHSDPPTPTSPLSPLHLSPPTPTSPLVSPPAPPREPCTGRGHLEDFLVSSTLLGVEPSGGLTLIDDLHSQMLSTAGILDHPPSPMDTSDLGFSTHTAGLDFGDAALDSMDWLDISMVGSSNSSGGSSTGGGGGDGGTSLTPLAPHTPPSVFSADFLDSTDLQLHLESCL
ncbi:myocardin related transcription factor Ab [Hippocampus zosterae]|uniref:myocardin related transcription factor Ab n=1 Tax=Hippocampus zosterae TaxID=109293 RepID=UPI00223C8E73|nr:myocardin related transcription factor Ab [Hippocampus zosterae]